MTIEQGVVDVQRRSRIERLTFETDHSEPLIAMLNRSRGETASDELLLHSAGPITDLAQSSMLPCLDSIRILFFEPHYNPTAAPHRGSPQSGSPLAGEVGLGAPEPLVMVIQEWHDERWRTFDEHRPASLAQALEITREFEVATASPNSTTDSSQSADALVTSPITPGGFAGLLGYDMGRWASDIRLANNPEPGQLLGVLWRCDAWWVHERESDKLHLIALDGHPWLAAAEHSPATAFQEAQEVQIAPVTRATVPESESDSEHARAVERIRESIRGGHLYQLNYGRRWQGPMSDDPWLAFLRMTRSNPAPYASWLHLADHGWAVASASPERLLRLRDGVVSTRPIKGTRARGATEEEDLALRVEMASSTKEIAEHLMLVDLERHDLSRVCESDSVHWADWRVEALANVQHLVSGVQGRLAAEADAGAALAALFPGGSIIGCPKTVTMTAIDELEGEPRGAWTGSIGHMNSGAGEADWNILIRTLEAHSGPNEWHGVVQAGGGVVIDSIPAAEVEEARWKAAAITEATWGFRTGFSATELPEREVGILPVPQVEGALGQVRPSENPEIGTQAVERDCPRVLLVDNLDSFSNNIAQALHRLGAEVVIVEGRPAERADAATTIEAWLAEHEPTHIILGPGPSRPEVSAPTMELASRAIRGDLTRNGTPERVDEAIPILGWCLGHQALGLAAGYKLTESPLGAVHGVPSTILNNGSGLYQGLESELTLMRYNSLILEAQTTTPQLIPNAWDESRTLIMGVRHRTLPIHGVQFHPESVGSPDGLDLLAAFLNLEAEQIPQTTTKPQTE